MTMATPCAICLLSKDDNAEAMIKTECGHDYHLSCILIYATFGTRNKEQHVPCPICRKALMSREDARLYVTSTEVARTEPTIGDNQVNNNNSNEANSNNSNDIESNMTNVADNRAPRTRTSIHNTIVIRNRTWIDLFGCISPFLCGVSTVAIALVIIILSVSSSK